MKLLAWLLDLLYPPKCVICGKLLEKQGPVCPRCLDSLPEYDGAAPQVRFTEAGAVSFYYEGTLRESFLRFKFGGAAHYAARFDTLTWAPVSRRRRRSRGYDQSELLCREIAKRLGLEPVRLLRKTRNPPAQSTMADPAGRRANVSGAYEPERAARLDGRRVLLIDDIVTTGATLAECSRVLRTAGASDVVYAAFAAPRKQD